MATSPKVASVDDAIDAVASVERRNVLVALLDQQPVDEVPPTTDGSGEGGDSAARRVIMVHVHLPKLDDYGFVDWDRAAGEVWRGPNFEDVRSIVEILDEHEDDLPPGWR